MWRWDPMKTMARKISATVSVSKARRRGERGKGSFVPANFAKTLLHSFKVAIIPV